MAVDYTQLSDADLAALSANDYASLSDEGLAVLSGESPAPSTAPAAPVAVPKKAAPRPKYKDLDFADRHTMLNGTMALPEAVTDMATGIAGSALGNIAGIGAIPYDYLLRKFGKAGVNPEEVRATVSNAVHIKPKTGGGQLVSEYNPLAIAGKMIGAGTHAISTGVTDNPTYQQMIDEAVPNILTLAGAKVKPSQIPGVKATGKVLNFIPNTIANVMRPHTKAGVIKNTGLLMNKLAGDRQPAILNALDNARYADDPFISAGQAAHSAGSAEFSALQKIADSLDPSYAIARNASQAGLRDAKLASVTPNLQASELARENASRPFYNINDKTMVQLDGPLHQLMGDLPRGVLNDAENIARMSGRPLMHGQHVPASRTYDSLTNSFTNKPAQYPSVLGADMHNIKTGISTRVNNPVIDGAEGIVSRDVLSEYLRQLETKSPAYGQARQAFKDASVPVNQSNVLNAMRKTLDGQGGRERFSSYMNTMGRGEDSLLYRATGYHNTGGLESLLAPKQLGTVRNVADELTRNADMAQAASAGTPKVLEAIQGFGKPLQLPGMLMAPITIFNSLLGKFENVGRAKTLEQVAIAMKNPALAAQIMRKATPKQKSILMQALNTNEASMIAAQQALPETEDQNGQ